MSKSSLVLERIRENELQTEGKLYVYNDTDLVFECVVLELPWKDNKRNVSRIPSNHYPATKHQSPKFGNSIWVQDVKGRSEILIHVGNFSQTDTLGCILVGEKFVDISGDGQHDISNSRETMNKLYSLVTDDMYINIIEKF